MKNLFTKLRSLPKRTSALMAIALAVLVVPAVLYAWGPSDRPTYTMEKPADHVTFNSITNNPSHGDERNFVQIRNYTDNGKFGEQVSLQPGKEYEVYVYYHNDASVTFNSAEHNYKGIAQGAYMRVEMPETVPAGNNARINGFVGATNASPRQVWDEAYAKNETSGGMALRYVPNSAKIHSNGKIDGQQIDLAKLAGANGTPLGFDALDGKLPGCIEYAGWVTYRFTAVQPNFEVIKEVSLSGANDFKKDLAATAGAEVQYSIEYKNTGNVQQDNVTIRDVLPSGMTYVAGSSYLKHANSNGWAKISDNITTANGVNIGSYGPTANAFVMFKAKLPAADKLECGVNTFNNIVHVDTENGRKTDNAKVTVTKDCPKPEPIYACDSLTVTKLERTKFQFDVKHTAKDAALKTTTYVVKDSNGTEVYRGPSATYSQSKVGNYTVEALLTFTVDGKDVTLPAGKCKASFEVKAEPVTPNPAVEIKKTVNGVKDTVVNVDDPFVYTLVVKNTGNITLKNVKVEDKAPEGVTFQSANKGEIVNNVWTYTIGELKTDASETIEITAIVKEYVEGKIKNTACVNAPEVNPSNPDENDDCDDATISVPKPEELVVCLLKDKKYPVTIKKDDFDETKHSMDPKDCDEEPVTPVEPETPKTPETPTQLPRTGAVDSILNTLGLGALVTASLAYIASRRVN